MADDPRDLARGLISSEPFMVIPSLVAQGGQKVMDAWDTIKSHVEDLANKAMPTVEAAGQSVSQALTPTVPTSNPPEAEAAPKKLTSAEFAASIKAKYPVYKSVPDDELTAKMLQKYPTYQDRVEAPAPMDWRQAVGKGQVIFSNKVLAGAKENLPAIGGTVGQIAAGPAGAFAGGMTGERLKQYANAATGTEPLPGQLDASGRMLKEGAIQGGLALGGELIGKGMEKGAQAVYRSYLKPSLAAKLAPKAEGIVNTALEEALPVTKGGVQKAQGLISGLNQQVQDVLDTSKGEVDLHDVADRLRMWATKTYYKPGVSTGDYESALAVADSIDKHASLGVKALFTPSVDVSVSEANASKQALQKAARNAYGTQSSATTTAQKVGASEMRQAIETQAPEVAGLNAREAKLIDAAKAIARAVGREGNQYKMHGTKAMVGALVGSEETARTGDPWGSAAKGLAVTLALQPGVATRAAIVASRLGKMSGIAPASAARLAIAAIKSEPDMAPTEQPSNVVQVGPYRVEPQ